MDVQSVIEANLADVRSRIAAACERSGRDVGSVKLVAVTKYAELAWVRALLDAGHDSLGESRPQQLVERAELLADRVPEWHMVGHLQRNKVRRTLPVATWTHSVDSLRLLETIDRIAAEDELRPQVLIEVNIGGEDSKDGFSIDTVRRDWEEICSCEHVSVAGLMTMPPRADDEAVRAYFRTLRELRDELADRSHGDRPLPELSMGTSGDYPIAVEEGATMVRVGRTLFEGLG